MTALWLWVTGLGLAGILGLIVMFFFAHAIFLIVVKYIADGFMWFFRTRIGFGVVVGFTVWYGTSWYQRHIDTVAFEKEKAEFKAAQKRLADDIQKDTELFVRKEIADEFMAQQEQNDAVADFKKSLDPADVCRIGADAPRLRAITGTGRPQGRDHKGMRKAPAKKVVP